MIKNYKNDICTMTECNCNRGDIPRIVRGNDFTLRVAVKHPVLTSDGNTELEDFDISTCTDIKVTLVTRLGKRKEMPFSIGDNADNTCKVILVSFDETVPSGLYGLEIVGKDKEGNDWRFYGAPGEVLQIVEPTSAAFIPSADTTEGYYDLTVDLGVLQYSQGILDDMKSTIDKSKTVFSANEKATKECIEATMAAKDATENANKAVDTAKKILKETLTVSLSCNHDEDITGKKVYIKNSEDDSVLEQHDWQGETIRTSIMPDQKYYVECEEMESYTVPKSDKFTAISGNVREVSLAYESEWFYPTVLMEDGTDAGPVGFELVYNIMGERVQMKYTTGMVIKIPFGERYQMVCASKAGYYSGIMPQRVAKEAEYHASTTYKIAQTQIGIQMVDGTIVSADDWDDAKYDTANVNGIMVCTTGVQCIMAPKMPESFPISFRKLEVGELPEGVDVAFQYIYVKGQLGEANTLAMIKGGFESPYLATGYCYNTILKNGKRCYLPAYDEITALYANKEEINKCSQKILGKDIIDKKKGKISSTAYIQNNVLYFFELGDLPNSSLVTDSHLCLAIASV